VRASERASANNRLLAQPEQGKLGLGLGLGVRLHAVARVQPRLDSYLTPYLSFQYIAFVVKSSKRANFNMTKETIRKIKLADNALMVSLPLMYIGMQGWTVAAIAEDRNTKRIAASVAWFTLAAVPVLSCAIADFSFMVILGAFTTFLESTTRLERTGSTAGPPKGDADGAGAEQASKEQSRRMSRRASSFFTFRRVAPDSSSSLHERQMSKSESVTRIEKQVATLRKMRLMFPWVGVLLGTIGLTCAFSVSGAYAGGVGIVVTLAIYGLFLSTSTIMMYNLGTRKRVNDAKKRERQASRAAPGAGAGGAASTSAPSTAQSTMS
jgi:hypothetical protein